MYTEGRAQTTSVLIRMFIKIVRGKAGIQSDVGNQPLWDRSDTEDSPNGWLQVSQIVTTDHLTDLEARMAFIFSCYGEDAGPGRGNTGPFEM